MTDEDGESSMLRYRLFRPGITSMADNESTAVRSIRRGIET